MNLDYSNTNSTNPYKVGDWKDVLDFFDLKIKLESKINKLDEKIKKIFIKSCRAGKGCIVFSILRHNERKNFIDQKTINEEFLQACKSEKYCKLRLAFLTSRVFDSDKEVVRKAFKMLCSLENAYKGDLSPILSRAFIDLNTLKDGFLLAHDCKNDNLIQYLLKFDGKKAGYGRNKNALLNLKIGNKFIEKRFEKSQYQKFLYIVCLERRISYTTFFKRLRQLYLVKDDKVLEILCKGWWAGELREYDASIIIKAVKKFFSKGCKIVGTDYSDDPPPLDKLLLLVADEIQEEKERKKKEQEEELRLEKLKEEEEQCCRDEVHRESVIQAITKNDQLSLEIEQEIDGVNEEDSEEELNCN